MSVQRIVEDSPAIELQAEAQHTSGEVETPVIDITLFLIFNHKTEYKMKNRCIPFNKLSDVY